MTPGFKNYGNTIPTLVQYIEKVPEKQLFFVFYRVSKNENETFRENDEFCVILY